MICDHDQPRVKVALAGYTDSKVSNVCPKRHSDAITSLDIKLLLQSERKGIAFRVELLIRQSLPLCLHGQTVGESLND